jgi:hypothetical protein
MAHQIWSSNPQSTVKPRRECRRYRLALLCWFCQNWSVAEDYMSVEPIRLIHDVSGDCTVLDWEFINRLDEEFEASINFD